MIAIVDYGVGNLFSLKSSFEAIGKEAVATADETIIRNADHILLPGVGAFKDAYLKLKESGLDKVLIECAEKGTPILGVCLGMQLLFDKSYEYGTCPGLGLIKGEITGLAGRISEELKIPHMGWNALKFTGKGQAADGTALGSDGVHDLFKYINEGDHVYFVHSFSAVSCEESMIAVCEYGTNVTAAVAKGNVMGCQFHPEKSGDVGLKILKAFCEMQ